MVRDQNYFPLLLYSRVPQSDAKMWTLSNEFYLKWPVTEKYRTVKIGLLTRKTLKTVTFKQLNQFGNRFKRFKRFSVSLAGATDARLLYNRLIFWHLLRHKAQNIVTGRDFPTVLTAKLPNMIVKNYYLQMKYTDQTTKTETSNILKLTISGEKLNWKTKFDSILSHGLEYFSKKS